MKLAPSLAMATVTMLLAVACKGKDTSSSPVTAPPSSAGDAFATSSPASPASGAASSPAQIATHRYVSPAGCPKSQDAIAAARAFAAAENWYEARSAFIDAIRARPFDPSLRIEYTHAAAQIDDARDAQYQALLATLMTKDAAIRARAWFELGALYEKRAVSKELTRACYAVAERYGSKDAKAKVGAESHCPAMWSTTHDPENTGEMLAGYGATRTAGDLTIRTRRGGFDVLYRTVNPGKIGAAGKDAYVTGADVWSDDTRSPPCKLELEGISNLQRFPRQARPGDPTANPIDGAPTPMDPSTILTRWSRGQKFLFTLTTYFPDVTATLTKDKARITGQGCDLDVPLP